MYLSYSPVLIEHNIIMKIRQLGFFDHYRHVMPLIIIGWLIHIIIPAIGSNTDASPDETKGKHLTEVVCAPGYDLSAVVFGFDPGRYGPCPRAGNAFVFGNLDVPIAVELQRFACPALNRIFIKR